jgi:hypothetical protein
MYSNTLHRLVSLYKLVEKREEGLDNNIHKHQYWDLDPKPLFQHNLRKRHNLLVELLELECCRRNSV